MTRIELTTLKIKGSDCICKCKSSYHIIAAMATPDGIGHWFPNLFYFFILGISVL